MTVGDENEHGPIKYWHLEFVEFLEFVFLRLQFSAVMATGYNEVVNIHSTNSDEFVAIIFQKHTLV